MAGLEFTPDPLSPLQSATYNNFVVDIFLASVSIPASTSNYFGSPFLTSQITSDRPSRHSLYQEQQHYLDQLCPFASCAGPSFPSRAALQEHVRKNHRDELVNPASAKAKARQNRSRSRSDVSDTSFMNTASIYSCSELDDKRRESVAGVGLSTGFISSLASHSIGSVKVQNRCVGA